MNENNINQSQQIYHTHFKIQVPEPEKVSKIVGHWIICRCCPFGTPSKYLWITQQNVAKYIHSFDNVPSCHLVKLIIHLIYCSNNQFSACIVYDCNYYVIEVVLCADAKMIWLLWNENPIYWNQCCNFFIQILQWNLHSSKCYNYENGNQNPRVFDFHHLIPIYEPNRYMINTEIGNINRQINNALSLGSISQKNKHNLYMTWNNCLLTTAKPETIQLFHHIKVVCNSDDLTIIIICDELLQSNNDNIFILCPLAWINTWQSCIKNRLVKNTTTKCFRIYDQRSYASFILYEQMNRENSKKPKNIIAIISEEFLGHHLDLYETLQTFDFNTFIYYYCFSLSYWISKLALFTESNYLYILLQSNYISLSYSPTNWLSWILPNAVQSNLLLLQPLLQSISINENQQQQQSRNALDTRNLTTVDTRNLTSVDTRNPNISKLYSNYIKDLTTIPEINNQTIPITVITNIKNKKNKLTITTLKQSIKVAESLLSSETRKTILMYHNPYDKKMIYNFIEKNNQKKKDVYVCYIPKDFRHFETTLKQIQYSNDNKNTIAFVSTNNRLITAKRLPFVHSIFFIACVAPLFSQWPLVGIKTNFFVFFQRTMNDNESEQEKLNQWKRIQLYQEIYYQRPLMN